MTFPRSLAPWCLLPWCWASLSGCNAVEESVPPTVVAAAIAAPVDTAPAAARKYRADLTRNARVVWGLEAPIPVFGAQVEQESGWREDAQSKFADGIAQFTPATAEWISGAYKELGPAQPFNPQWALRAMVRYDRHLYDRVDGAANECEQVAFTLAGYNGGAGWVQRDRALAARTGRDASRYFGQVDTVNAGRAEIFWRENTAYPRLILKSRQKKYVTWGRTVCL